MYFCIGIADITAQLLFGKQNVGKRETTAIRIPGLFLQFAVVQTPSVDAGRCTGFHPAGFESQRNQLLRKTCSSLFPCPAASKTLLPDMNYPVQESAIG